MYWTEYDKILNGFPKIIFYTLFFVAYTLKHSAFAENITEYDPDVVTFKFYPHQNKKPPKKWVIDTNSKTKNQLVRLDEPETGFDLTDEEIAKFKIWPQGVISFYIDEYSFDHILRDRLRAYLESAGAITGLHFSELHSPPKDENTRWVIFINRRGILQCVDYTTADFTNYGVQKVILGYDCLTVDGRFAGTILALAGVPPMHRAPDKENHINVYEENIIPGKEELFEPLQDSEWLFHDIEYDFESAGHYHPYKFSKNGLSTIRAKKYSEEFGESKTFSYIDVWKISMLYNYIKKKNKPTVNVTECKRIFFDLNTTYASESDEQLTPRLKPHEYLASTDTNLYEDIQPLELKLRATMKTVTDKNDKHMTVDNSENKIVPRKGRGTPLKYKFYKKKGVQKKKKI